MNTRATIRSGGLFLICGALAFVAVFAFLAARFNYPEVLDGPAAEVLPRLLETGQMGRFVWALYSILPLIWIPAGVGAYAALAPAHRGPMLIALICAVLSSFAMMLGLMRWPSMHWHLAQAYAQAGPTDRVALTALFDGLNAYLGNYIGEFLGELAFSMFFLLTSIVWLQARRPARWIGWAGVLTAISGLVGMFRNTTELVAPIAAVNNYLLPAFMIALGVALWRWPEPSAGA